jgi:hypothetical protein
MFYVYGFDLSHRLWLVSIVKSSIVVCLFGCVFSTILVVSPYMPFCVYHLPKWHMMCVHFERFTVLLWIIVLVWHFPPGSRLFLVTCNKSSDRYLPVILSLTLSVFTLEFVLPLIINQEFFLSGSIPLDLSSRSCQVVHTTVSFLPFSSLHTSSRPYSDPSFVLFPSWSV